MIGQIRNIQTKDVTHMQITGFVQGIIGRHGKVKMLKRRCEVELPKRTNST